MLTVLIVDDEEWIRYLIKKVVDWEKNGFKIVGEASNGFEALNLINQFSPDVVITDIKMQKMDGIEMMAEAKSSKPDIYFIMLSGYDSFEYAQKSLNLGAFAYLLKPLNESQLVDILERLKQQKSNINNYENLKIVNLEYQRKSFLGNLIDGEIYSDDELSMIKDECSIILENRIFYILTINISEHDHAQEKTFPGELKEIVDGIAHETFIKSNFEIYSIYRKDRVITIISVPNNDRDEQIYSIIYKGCLNIIEKYKDISNIPITIAYEGSCSDIRHISSFYVRTQRLLDYRLVLGENRVIVCTDIESIRKYSFLSHQMEFDLIHAIEVGNKENVTKLITKLFKDIKAVESTDPISIKKSYYKILYGIFDVGYNSGINMQMLIGNEFEIYDQFDRMSSIDSIEKVLLHIAAKISDALYERKINKINPIVKSQEFILKHYSEDISLEKISESVYMSSYYLSSLFKKETGQNLSDFIKEVRINAACRLLHESKLKIFEVGENVGYKDPKYFCRIFKKVVGISPTDFKRNI